MNETPQWMGKRATFPAGQASIFFDGIFSEPQLNHPEGLAFDSSGNVWCGGEQGEIFRIDSKGKGIELIASTGGFALGLAFDANGYLYVCDLKHSAVFRLNPHNNELIRFADGDRKGNSIKIPNVPVVDDRNDWLYVSDSFHPQQSGPGIWRFDLATGKGELWYAEPLCFANGLALSHEHNCLYVAETFDRQISRIPLQPDGSPGEKEVVTKVDALPDGVTLDRNGIIYIACYEPSLIYRWSEKAGVELLYYDPEASVLCHPTNCAFHGNDLYTSNLGRWHITKIKDVI